MKTELKTKFPQHLAQENQGEDLTLIELLIVFIIFIIMSVLPCPTSSTKPTKKSSHKQSRMSA